MVRASLVVTAALLSGCATTEVWFPEQQKILITGNTLVYDGAITGGAVLEAIRIVRESDQKIDTLRITSPGGDMEAGIEFGYFVKENNWDVVVSKLCFSACANYVLTAGKNVEVKKDSLIGWHGGAKQDDELWKHSVPIDAQEQFFAYLNHLRIKETKFFETIEVDQHITNYGQTKNTSCQNNQTIDGWHYTIDDLHHMGVKNITVQGDKLLTELDYNNEPVHSCLMPSLFN
ncbi:hypothetical protein [Vibrio paucivorans]|uniref:Lipoprotein n=1 Tax=Vibrio paucivorans TaxID=2829489 RepID=A0A9X3HTV7_9VIBR|nr:hypothetical protein [Vibrio paucivorans]